MPTQVAVPISKREEPEARITLVNGAVLVLRTIVMAAHQIMTDDGKPMLGPDNKPMIGLNTQTLVAVEKEPVERKEMN